ncbi:hypothetical protein ACFYNN_36190 [Streptomyces sp. NPDC006978]|uniref:hypothetical protein n=1 Tax=Streptomyces sp. NPDC006978 TaxID=3364769 RepID=UPI0036BCE1AF
MDIFRKSYPVAGVVVAAALIAAAPAQAVPEPRGELDGAAVVKTDGKVGHLVDVNGKVISKVDLLTGKSSSS